MMTMRITIILLMQHSKRKSRPVTKSTGH